ncbi:MAG: hypothetical protein Q8P34_14985, partial [Bacteroidota bacterium]|nr:hypothetical protein [Bacteroidota bacterium]
NQRRYNVKTTWQVKLVGKKILSAATALPFNHPNYESKLNYSIPRIADIFWIICRNEFMSDKDLRLFAVGCAREVFKLVDFVLPASIYAVDLAERVANGELYANGNEISDELAKAASAAWIARLKHATVIDSGIRMTAARAASKSAAFAAVNAARDSAEALAVVLWSATLPKEEVKCLSEISVKLVEVARQRAVTAEAAENTMWWKIIRAESPEARKIALSAWLACRAENVIRLREEEEGVKQSAVVAENAAMATVVEIVRMQQINQLLIYFK